MKTITDEQIGAIKDFLKNRNTLQIRKILNELEEPKDELRYKLNKFLRERGRSTILESDINQILDDTKLNEGGKMEETEEEKDEAEESEEKKEDEESSGE